MKRKIKIIETRVSENSRSDFVFVSVKSTKGKALNCANGQSFENTVKFAKKLFTNNNVGGNM